MDLSNLGIAYRALGRADVAHGTYVYLQRRTARCLAHTRWLAWRTLTRG